jgi:hypothetical protein
MVLRPTYSLAYPKKLLPHPHPTLKLLNLHRPRSHQKPHLRPKNPHRPRPARNLRLPDSYPPPPPLLSPHPPLNQSHLPRQAPSPQIRWLVVPPRPILLWSIQPPLVLHLPLPLVDVEGEGGDRLMCSDIRLEVGIGRWEFDILPRWPLRTLRRCAPGSISLFSSSLLGIHPFV